MPSARLPGLPNQVASEERSSSASTTPYERLVRAQQQDAKWQSEVSLGKRIGFYRIRGDLGSGNFSQVKMAVHQLTRERVAIKILDKSKLDQKTRKMLSHEINTMEGVVKLGDFGFSTQLTTGREQQLTTFCGSPPYAAPELFRDESYVGAPVDIWALGVLLFFMVTGQMPFKAHTVAALKKQILDCNYSVPPHVSSACKQVIVGILQLEPSSRLSLQSVSEAEFLRGVRLPRSAEASAPAASSSAAAAAAPSGESDAGSGSGSEHEAEALQKLEELGISRALLDEHRGRGSKSAVVGTYRILLHRLERRAASAQSLAADDADGEAPARGGGGGVGALAARLRSGGGRVRMRKPARSGGGGGASQSRACALL